MSKSVGDITSRQWVNTEPQVQDAGLAIVLTASAPCLKIESQG